MTNYRGELQELCQQRGASHPTYDTINTGSDHEPIWFSTCKALDCTTGGTGRTVKEANSNAAKILLNMLNTDSEMTSGIEGTNPVYSFTTFPEDVNVSSKIEESPHIAKLMFAAVETEWEPVLIDHKYLNLQNCFAEMWQWEDNFSVFNGMGRVPNTPGEWYKCHVDGFSLVFHCPDGNPPTKESAILFG